jgi:hypothetical protein
VAWWCTPKIGVNTNDLINSSIFITARDCCLLSCSRSHQESGGQVEVGSVVSSQGAIRDKGCHQFLVILMFVTNCNTGGGSCHEWYFTRERAVIRDKAYQQFLLRSAIRANSCQFVPFRDKGCQQFLRHYHIRDKLQYRGVGAVRNGILRVKRALLVTRLLTRWGRAVSTAFWKPRRRGDPVANSAGYWCCMVWSPLDE